jgi:outer membrane lipase/esterase
MFSQRLRFKLCSIFAFFCFGLVGVSRAGSLVAFGDSLVDNGNTPRITGLPFPPAPLYVGFRYSNGPTFAEYLPGLLDLNSNVGTAYGTGTNFGVGGALSGSGNTTSIPGVGLLPLPGLADQISLFQNEGKRFGGRDLVAVWAGANDYFQLINSPTGLPSPALATATVVQATTNLESAADRLINLGARRLVFINLPDLGKLPLVNSIANPVQRTIVSGAATQLTDNHNLLLASNLARLHSQTGANIFLFSADLAFHQILANPPRYGFTNVTEAANANPAILFAPLAVQNRYLFWDSVHPTTAAHLILARYIANMVEAPTTLASQTQLLTYGTRAFGDLLYNQLGPLPLQTAAAPLAVPTTEGKATLSLAKAPVAPSTNTFSLGPESRWSVFLVGDYRQGTRDDQFNSLGFDYYLGNVALGGSYTFNQLITAGLLFGYGYNKADLDNGQGHVEVDAYQVGGFLDFHGPNWFVGGVVSFGYDEYDQRRPGILGDTIKSEPHGQTVLAGAQSGYFWRLGDFSAGPIGSLTFTSVNVESFSETGDPILTQEVRSRRANDLFGTIGLRAGYDFHLGTTLVQPYVKAEYEHEILGDGITIKSRFTAEPALELQTQVENSSPDYGRIGAGFRLHFTERFSGQLGFDALVGRSDGEEYTGSAGISISF